ncbi:hypothetical protein ACFE04_000949 [Oxalis oulophora]
MEKRLRTSLQSSAESFLTETKKLNLTQKSTKSTLKTLIFSISKSSPIPSSLTQSLHYSITQSLTKHPQSSPTNSPPSKRLRRSSTEPQSEPDSSSIQSLQILSHITLLCAIHPKRVFSAEALLPSAQVLHDNLILFESNALLSTEVASLCEEWWKAELPGRQMLISQTLPFLLSRSLTLKKKVDLHRVYAMREAFNLLDFDDESIVDLKMLLIRCVIAPLFLKTEEGRKFVAFLCGLSMQVLKEALAMIKTQIAFGRKSMLDAFGDILFRAWKGLEGEFKLEIEDGFLQMLIEAAIHGSSGAFASSVRRVLGGFLSQRTVAGVDKMLFRLAQPVIFRSLQIANSNVRQNALHLLLDLFPVEDPDSTKEEKDVLLDKQFFLLERLVIDDCPDTRAVAVEGCCRVLHQFWEIIPSSTITKMLKKVFDDMSHDVCSEVRLSTVKGIIYLLGNPLSHEILKVLLARLGHLMLDNVLSLRVAIVDLLLLTKDFPTFQFNKVQMSLNLLVIVCLALLKYLVVVLDILLSALANDQPQVAQKITRLLIPSYFPSTVPIEEACNRCVALLKRSPAAGARFCEFFALEGTSRKSILELVKVLIGLVLSHSKLQENQIENMLVAASHLCESLVSEKTYKNALKTLLSIENLKLLFATANSGWARSSVLKMVSFVSTQNESELIKECKRVITNCSGLSENLEMQDEVRSAYKLFLHCGGFGDVFETLSDFLQKTAYRCHIKFGTENIASTKRKKCSSNKNTTKWKHVGGKKSSSFEEDYSVAVGISWQIKDLLTWPEPRKPVLESESLESVFLALKVISEVSIEQCMRSEFMDTFPVLAYTNLGLHMTLENVGASDCGSVLDHLLYCTEKLLVSGESSKESKQNCNTPTHHGTKKQKEPKIGGSHSCKDGSGDMSEKKISNKVMMLAAVLKFIVDAKSMNLLPLHSEKCLSFTTTFIQNIISMLKTHSKDQIQILGQPELMSCLKSSLTYAFKLLRLTLKDTNEISQPPPEVFHLANGLLDLIGLTELHFGSSCAAKLVAATKPWLPDLILALGSGCMFKQTGEEGKCNYVLDLVKPNFPSWLSILAKTELHEVSTEDGDDGVSEFSAFKKLMEMIILLLKRDLKILGGVGIIFLIGSIIGLEKKDSGLVQGLIRFVCKKLIGLEDKEWKGLEIMLALVPEIYLSLEREIDEQSREDDKQKFDNARSWLEPVWLYHVTRLLGVEVQRCKPIGHYHSDDELPNKITSFYNVLVAGWYACVDHDQTKSRSKCAYRPLKRLANIELVMELRPNNKLQNLLTRDYNSDQKFSVYSYSDAGVAITSSAVKKGGLSTGDVAAQYKYKNTLFDVKVDTDSNVLTTITFTEILPSTKTIASFKVPDYNSGKLEVQYFHDHATLTAAACLNKQSPLIDVSATIGTPSIAFGAEAGYDTTSGNFTKYTAGISVVKPDSCASILLGDKGDTIKASYVHHLDQLRRSAAVGELTRRFSTNENTITVGGSFAIDPLTTVKAKLNNNGKLGALLQHQIIPKSLLTVSSEIDTKALDKYPRFGLAIALKP